MIKKLNGWYTIYKCYRKKDGNGGNSASLSDTRDDLSEAKGAADRLFVESLSDTYEILIKVVVQDATEKVFYERSVVDEEQ